MPRKVTLCRLSSEVKLPLPIRRTEAGMVSSFRALRPIKLLLPITFSESGRRIFSRALIQISVMPSMASRVSGRTRRVMVSSPFLYI